MALLVPLLRSASHRDTYEPSLTLPVARRCARPYVRSAPRATGRPRCARPLRAASSRVPLHRLPAPPGFAVRDRLSSSRCFAPLRTGTRTSPRWRYRSPAAVRGPTFAPLLGRCDTCAGLQTTPPQGRPEFPCTRRTWNPGTRADVRRARSPQYRKRRVGSRRGGIGLEAARGGRAQRGRPVSPEERSERRASYSGG